VYEQAWMEHCQAVGPMRRTVVALLALSLSSACGIIMVGEPVQKLDISAEDDAEGNLKAVRTMFKGSGMRQLGEEIKAGKERSEQNQKQEKKTQRPPCAAASFCFFP